MGVVVHAYDCSYEDHSPMPAQDKTWNPTYKTAKAKKDWGVAQVSRMLT
jgi:hypothetical protein